MIRESLLALRTTNAPIAWPALVVSLYLPGIGLGCTAGDLTVAIGSDVTYLTFARKSDDQEVSLSKRAAWPKSYSFGDSSFQPGSASIHRIKKPHCVQLELAGGKQNPYYNGGNHDLGSWASGACPNPPYNFFNKNSTLDAGVVQSTYGIGMY